MRKMQLASDGQRSLGLHALPDELLALALSFLASTRDLGRADCVCRAWHAAGSPVERALILRIQARGALVPAARPAGAGSLIQWLCWLEILNAAQGSSDIVGAGTTLSAAVDAHGRLCVWGDVTDREELIFDCPVPSVVTPFVGVRVERVSVGEAHLLALTDTGEVLSFGAGRLLQLGHGDAVHRREPKVIETLRGVRVVAIAAGDCHNMVLTDEGVVLSFGPGLYGRLGHADEEDQLRPKAIEALRDKRVVAMAAGGGHSLVLTDRGDVFSFGYGREGQLGHGDRADQLEPKRIEALRGFRVVAIAAGERHSMVLTDKGAVLAFGYGREGQLGHGCVCDRCLPIAVEALRCVHAVAIAAGSFHSMVLTDKGVTLSFGPRHCCETCC